MSLIPLNPVLEDARARQRALTEARDKLMEGSLAADAKSKTPASVHVGKVFDDKDPAASYPTGTEINFGETAPIDMGGIPDLFDPSAVTGDGI